MPSHPTLRNFCQFAIGVAIAAVILRTWLLLGLIDPVTVAGSSMAPTLLGAHRMFRCPDCAREFPVGLDQLPRGERAACPDCGQSRATVAGADRGGDRLVIDRSAFLWRAPRRWEVAVFRAPHGADQLWIKRVVGLPGESISFLDGDLVINREVVRKTLTQQRSVRHLVHGHPIDINQKVALAHVPQLSILAPNRWSLIVAGRSAAPGAEDRSQDTCWIEYRHLNDGPVTDEASYNQRAARVFNPVRDVMLTFSARLAGTGQLLLAAEDEAARGRWELAIDFGARRFALSRGGRLLHTQPFGPEIGRENRSAEWTFSLFDRQVLLAVGDDVVFAVEADRQLSSPEEATQVSLAAEIAGRRAGPPPFAVGFRGLTGEIRDLAVWRDAYYEVRHGDNPHPVPAFASSGSTPRVAPLEGWRLGPTEFFVVGDNAPISDDSRNWLLGGGLDAKLLIGKPLGVR